MASNTKIDHIMASFTHHYNAIFIDSLTSKPKTGKHSRYFINSPISKLELSLTTEFSLFINTQPTHSSASDRRKNTKFSFKEGVRTCSENSRKN